MVVFCHPEAGFGIKMALISTFSDGIWTKNRAISRQGGVIINPLTLG